MDPEHIETKGVCYGASAHEGIMAGYAWKEISILKFLGGISGVKLEELASQAIVTVITSQEDELNFMDANEKDEECDEIFVTKTDKELHASKCVQAVVKCDKCGYISKDEEDLATHLLQEHSISSSNGLPKENLCT